ncbi:MAG: 3-methylaspartate ammonia-lyase, partial [bacterium]
PSVLANLDRILEEARKRAHEQFGLGKETGREVHFRVYGRDGVMGGLEPSGRTCHEAGLFIEAVAGTQEEATSLCMFAHASVLHQGFPGRTSTAGNLAFPMSPQDVPAGEVHRFSVYHLMEEDDPASLFPVKIVEV